MIFKDYLIRQKQAKHFSHSLIIETISCCDYKQMARDYLKALVCKEQIPFCGLCLDCQRIEHDNYIDFIYLDNNIEIILKEDAIAIQDKFNRQSSEAAGIKLYVIKNLEKANKFVLNSLLKFLEEPPHNTYALFMTCNNNLILNTIRSRSQLIIVEDQCNFNDLDITIPKELIINVFADYDEFKFCKDECDLNEIYKLSMAVIGTQNIEKQIINFNAIKDLSKLEFNLFFRFLIFLVKPQQRIAIEELFVNTKLNINKRTTIHMLFNILKNSDK